MRQLADLCPQSLALSHASRTARCKVVKGPAGSLPLGLVPLRLTAPFRASPLRNRPNSDRAARGTHWSRRCDRAPSWDTPKRWPSGSTSCRPRTRPSDRDPSSPSRHLPWRRPLPHRQG